MKSHLTIPCACGNQIPLEINGSELPEYAYCPACKATIYLVAPLGNFVTGLLMERAKQELAHNDATTCTLLSAVAVAEMAYLFFKWKSIDCGKLPATETPQDRKQWEEEWANMRSIGKRLDELSRLLTTKPFDEFAHLRKEILKPALTGYDCATSIKDFLQQGLFERRNDIAHYGKIDLLKEEGERSFSIASALLSLLHTMDAKRIGAMDEAHRKARELPPGSP